VRKTAGLIGILAVLVVTACIWELTRGGGTINFLRAQNLRQLSTWIGLFGILSLGQALVIVTGGIDLSVGSVVALVGTTLALLLDQGQGWSPWIAVPFCLGLSLAIGLWHGALVTKVRMQPFVVTLCGLFFYRGIARYIGEDKSHGFGFQTFEKLNFVSKGALFGLVPMPFLIMLGIAVLVGLLLHTTPQGRHLFALGANEESARFSGIATDRLKILAYVLCSFITGIGAILFSFKVGSLGPSGFGSFYELYAIAGAVLGGCSLRGGSGNIFGVVIGATLIVVLGNLVNILGIASQLEYVVIGGAILVGVFADEMLRRRTLSRRTPA
jgi:ribose transport system permease protein